MAESAAARALRLIDLVPFLVSNPGVSVKETATAFKVTVPELLKDLDILFMCGLPGYTALELIDLSVEDGVITIREPQNLEVPRRFTESEALILRVALSALEDLLPPDKKASVGKLRAKVSKLFSSQIPEDALFYQGDTSREKMKMISRAIEGRKKLEIIYFNPLKPDKSRRKISVLRVKAEPKRTLIEAWCDSSRGIRTFNLAQIEELEIKDEAIEEIDLQDKEERISAVVQAPADSYFAIENQAQLHQIAEGYEIEIFQPEWLVRKVLAEAGSAVLRSPSMMATRVRELASRSLALYQ
ncbi:MAG: hypothetical protein RIS57_11 [Actinomycetota bacterium]